MKTKTVQKKFKDLETPIIYVRMVNRTPDGFDIVLHIVERWQSQKRERGAEESNRS